MDKKEKINRFLSDKVMQGAVYEVLLDTFIRPTPVTDVHTLAAQRLAIEMLQLSWKELEKYKNEQKAEKKELSQVGL